MIENMKHLQVLRDLNNEIQALLNEYNARESGITDKETLVALRLEQSEALTSLLAQQRRALKFMRGDEVQAEMHFGESVLTGVGVGSL